MPLLQQPRTGEIAALLLSMDHVRVRVLSDSGGDPTAEFVFLPGTVASESGVVLVLVSDLPSA